jgi:methyl-accepting chemotaxis protein
MDPVLKIFIYATAVAVVLQMFILLALFIVMRRTSSRLEALANEVHGRAMPILASADAILTNSKEHLQTVAANLAQSTTLLKGQIERIDVTVTDIVDRTRLQVIRADEMISRTMDRVEETTELVQHTVVSPVRQISGIVQGLSVGIGSFLGQRRRRRPNGTRTQDGEMFI